MPSCGVMVYYIRQDKEVVADSIQLDVEDKFENQVRIFFINNITYHYRSANTVRSMKISTAFKERGWVKICTACLSWYRHHCTD